MPLNVVSSPRRRSPGAFTQRLATTGNQIIDAHTGTIAQTISQPAAFFGLAFSNDGKTLYASGGTKT
jgi:hypothetical protein